MTLFYNPDHCELAGKAVSRNFNGFASKNESQPIIGGLKLIHKLRDPVISMNKNYLCITYKQVFVDSLNETDNQANLRWVSPKIPQIAFMKVKSKHCVYQ